MFLREISYAHLRSIIISFKKYSKDSNIINY